MDATLTSPLTTGTNIGSFFGIVMDVLSPRDPKTVEIAFGTLGGRRFRCTVPLNSAAPNALQVGAYVQISGVEMGPNYIHANCLRKSDVSCFGNA